MFTYFLELFLILHISGKNVKVKTFKGFLQLEISGHSNLAPSWGTHFVSLMILLNEKVVRPTMLDIFHFTRCCTHVYCDPDRLRNT